MTGLTIADLDVSVGGRPLIAALGLHVTRGEVVGVIGPNGSGKSTLLRAVYRALRPEAGTVRLDGDDLLALSHRDCARRLAVVAQENPGEFAFTVAETVMMGRTPHQGRFGRESDADRAAVDEALVRVGVADLAGRSFPTLSGGEKQRVLLARALAQDTRVIVLDEPTNHLDIGHQLELMALVRELDLTILMALHDLNLAAASCDRLYALNRGTVVAHGRPADVLTPTLLAEVFGVVAAVVTHPVTGAHQLLFVPPDPREQAGSPVVEPKVHQHVE